MATNNAIVFDTLGTDVDVLRQFTPEHLMKYLEYNSGSVPIPIRQIAVPFVMNRNSLSISVSPREWSERQKDSKESPAISFRIEATSKFSMRLFWSLPSSVYKKCSKDIAKRDCAFSASCAVICTKDPTLKSGFLNPFRAASDSASTLSFPEILRVLESHSRHSATPAVTASASSTYSFPIPPALLRRCCQTRSHVEELPTYHLDADALLIFDEKQPALRSCDSSARLLATMSRRLRPARPQRAGSVAGNTSGTSGTSGTSAGVASTAGTTRSVKDYLPLVVVLWAEEPRAERPARREQRAASQRSLSYLNSLMRTASSSHLSAIVSQQEAAVARSEKANLVTQMDAVTPTPPTTPTISTDEEEGATKPQFVSVVVVHFLKSETPTMIRRMNICPDGVYIPRVRVGERAEA